jgi:hypothetical protein
MTPYLPTEEQMHDIVDMHKKMMEAIAEHTSSYHNEEQEFLLVMQALSLTISNTMNTFGLKNTEPFLSDLTDYVKQIHGAVVKNSSYMEYVDGIKKSEGRFN